MERLKRGLVIFLALFFGTMGLQKLFPSKAETARQNAEMARQTDAKRISDLTEISRKVDAYWTQNGRLPASLDEVNPPSGVLVVNWLDPGTSQPYTYRVKDQRSYELCAEFDRSTQAQPQFAAGHFWSHPSGWQCIIVSAPKR
jgi:hypothetical protein